MTSRLKYMIQSQRVPNCRFCLGLAMHIFENMECGDISATTARAWYQLYRSAMRDVAILEITGIVDDPKCKATNTRLGGFAGSTNQMKDVVPSIADSIGRMFSDMVKRGWHEEAVEFLLQFVLQNLIDDDYHEPHPGAVFHELWLPLFRYILNHHRDGDSPEWKRIDPIFRNSLLSVVVVYAAGIIGREPKKSVRRRAALLDTCRCSSCRIVNSFLLNDRKERQIFKIVESQRGRRSRVHPHLVYNDFHIARSAVRHITRQLGHADRDCVFHVHETTAVGPALVLRKRDNQREWEKWKKRREEGRNRLDQIFMTRYFQDVVGCKLQYEEWKELKFLDRGATKIRIPFVVEHPQREDEGTLRSALAKLAIQISHSSRIQASLVDHRETNCEPGVVTMWWTDMRRKHLGLPAL